MADTLSKIVGTDVAIACGRANLPPEAQAALQGCTDVPDALTRLEAAGFLSEAIRVLAQSLPKRENVWWACMCAANTAPADLGEPDRQAREIAEVWVRQQKDEQRRQAMKLAEDAKFGSPEAWAGVAAFWSGDSLTPVELPAVPPPPQAAGNAVSAAISLSVVRGDLTKQQERLKRFLESGRNIASGGPGRMAPEQT
jgi:hypothetical protein